VSWFRESFHPSFFVFCLLILYNNIFIDYNLILHIYELVSLNSFSFSFSFFFLQQNTGYIINRSVVWGTNSYAQVRGCTRMCELSCKHGNQEGGEEGIYSFTNDGRMYAG